MQTALIYIHGFNSSPASFKARVLQKELAERAPGAIFMAPALPPSPTAATRLLEALVVAHPQAILVGSSLGGYYAGWLAERYDLRAVLVNPAVRPYELLHDHVGMQTNLYTGERYEFTAAHVEELRALEQARVTPARYLLMLETGDEVLDYFPPHSADQAAVEPIYEEMDGWKESTEGARSWADLPAQAIKYIQRVQELIETPVALVSTSPEREDTILVRDPFED